jgi:hypothetical protein
MAPETHESAQRRFISRLGVRVRAPRARCCQPRFAGFPTRYAVSDYSTRWPAGQPISQKSASSRVPSLKIAISSASRAGVGVETGEAFQVRPRFRRDFLLLGAGILGDPNGVRCGVRIGSRGEPRRDLRASDLAGGKRHLESWSQLDLGFCCKVGVYSHGVCKLGNWNQFGRNDVKFWAFAPWCPTTRVKIGLFFDETGLRTGH